VVAEGDLKKSGILGFLLKFDKKSDILDLLKRESVGHGNSTY
jgi:hypothetical protein